MSDFIYSFKSKIMQHYKKVLPVFLACTFMVLSPVRTFAFDSQPSSVLENSWVLHNTDHSFELMVAVGQDLVPHYFTDTYTDEQVADGSTMYSFHLDETLEAGIVQISNSNSRFDFEYVPELYDYYFLYQFFSGSSNLTEDFTFFPDYVGVLYSDFGNDISSNQRVDVSEYRCSLNDTLGFAVFGKFPDVQSGNTSDSFYWPVGFYMYSDGYDGTGTLPSGLNFEGLIIAMPKSTDSSASADIIELLQKIYDSLNTDGRSAAVYLETILYLLEVIMGYGIEPESLLGQNVEGVIDGLLGSNSSFSQYVFEYSQAETSMRESFVENQNAVNSNFTDWSWGSLATAVDWTSDYLNTIYDNSGDFRTMFMYPILAGIALIFIGRQGLSAYVRSKHSKGD